MAIRKEILRVLLLAIITGCTVKITAQGTRTQPEGVRVVVGKFFADEYVDKRMSSDVPFLVSRSLLNYNGLSIVEDKRFANITVYGKDYTQKYVQDEYAGLDYIIFGDIVMMNKELTINAFLLNVKNNLTRELKTVRGESSRLFDMCSEISREAAAIIYELEHGIRGQRITLALISNAQGNVKRGMETDYLTDLLIREAIQDLEYFENFDMMPYGTSTKFNGRYLEDILAEIKANGIINIMISMEKENMKVLIPTFYLKEDKNSRVVNMEIRMPFMHSNYYVNFDFKEFAINELIGFMQSIITKEGEWNLQPLLFTSDSPHGYIEKGDDYFKKPDLFLSNYFYYKAMDLAKDPELQNQILFKLGRNKAAEFRLEEAKEEFNKILARNPDHVLGIKGLGIISMAAKDYNDAFKKFSYVVELNPDEDDIHHLLGIALFETGDYKMALDELIKARSVDPYLPDISRYIGLCHVKLKNYDESIEVFRQLYEEDPENVDNRYYLSYAMAEKGIFEFNAGNYGKVIELLTESNRIYKLNYTNNYLRIAFIRLGEYDMAEKFIESEILKKNYTNSQIYFQNALDIREVFLGDIDPETGAQVIKNLEQSIAHNENNPMAYYYLGNTYINLGQSEKGLEYLHMAYEKDPANSDIHPDLMEAMLLNNQFKQCIEFYESLLPGTANFPFTDNYLAVMEYLMISALRLDGQKTDVHEKKLNKMLSGRLRISDWSFDAYKAWLEVNDFRQADKDFLLDLTKKMEDKINR